MSKQDRTELGDFCSVICMKALVVGVERVLGPQGAKGMLIDAGKKRGHSLAESLGLANSKMPNEELAKAMNLALGVEGTKLCIVDKVEDAKDNGLLIYTRETVCSAGEEDGASRECTYTLGAIIGVVESIYDKRVRGKHVECVLRGGDHDLFEMSLHDRF